MQNRLTIKDIARLSGVGKSTVSRVLNNESGVSERTRERVEAVMQQHGFSPSRSARAIRLVALIEAFKGVLAVAAASGLLLLLHKDLRTVAEHLVHHHEGLEPSREWRQHGEACIASLDVSHDELNHWVFRASHSRIPEIVELAKKIRRRRPDDERVVGLLDAVRFLQRRNVFR